MQEAWDQIEAIPGYARKKSSLLKVREFLGLLGEPDREFQGDPMWRGTKRKGFRLCIPHLHDPGSKNSLRDIRVPHLVDIRERFLINGEIVPEPEFIRHFWRYSMPVRYGKGEESPIPPILNFYFTWDSAYSGTRA